MSWASGSGVGGERSREVREDDATDFERPTPIHPDNYSYTPLLVLRSYLISL